MTLPVPGDTFAAKVAQLIARAHRLQCPVDEFPHGSGPTTLGEGFDIQRRVAVDLGGGISGWKAAIDGQGRMLSAPIFDSITYASGTDVDFRPNIPAAIEVEIAFVLGRDLPEKSAPYTKDDVCDAIAHIAPGIEVLQSRLGDFRELSPASMLADNLANHAYILGPLVAYRSEMALEALMLTASLDDECIWHAACSHPQSDPTAVLLALANSPPGHLGGLKSGQFVTTGNLCQTPVFISDPARISASFDMGSVEVTLTHRGSTKITSRNPSNTKSR